MQNETLKIAVTTKLRTTDTDISSSFEKTPYLLIVIVRNKELMMSFINRKGERVGGPYIDYLKVVLFNIFSNNEKVKWNELSTAQKVIENKVDAVITTNIDPSSHEELKNNNIPVYKANGNAREAIRKLVNNELKKI